MTHLIPFPLHRRRAVTKADCEAAWEVYAAHRAPEVDRPWLTDVPAHQAEARRLHAHFVMLVEAMEFGQPKQHGGDNAA